MEATSAVQLSPKLMVDTVLRPLATVLFVCAGYTRMVRAITRSILLPSTVLGKNKPQLEMCIKASRVEFKRVRIGQRLDGMILHDKDASKRGWLIYSNANGVCYEHILQYTHFLGAFFNCKVVVFNYRGVGDSLGTCTSAQDMVDDLNEVVEYVLQLRAAQEEKQRGEILLWGHSIGGAITLMTASALARKKTDLKLKLVIDRSFAHLEDVVKEKISIGPLASIIGGLLLSSLSLAITVVGLVGFGTHPWPTSSTENGTNLDMLRALLSGLSLGFVSLKMERPFQIPFAFGFFGQLFVGTYGLKSFYALDSLPCIMVLSFAAAFEMGSRGWFNSSLLRLVSAQGWTMNPRKDLETCENAGERIVITFHEEDEMISPEYSMKTIGNKFPHCRIMEVEHAPNYAMGGIRNNHMNDLSLTHLEHIKSALEWRS